MLTDTSLDMADQEAVTIDSYQASSAQELSVASQERVQILRKQSTWWYCKNSSGATGYVPVSCFSKALPKAQGTVPEVACDKAVACWNYVAVADHELSLCKGETLTVTQRISDEWWFGKTVDGREGTFPSDYVKLLSAQGADDEEDQLVEAVYDKFALRDQPVVASESTKSDMSQQQFSSSTRTEVVETNDDYFEVLNEVLDVPISSVQLFKRGQNICMDKTKEEGNRTRILKQEWALPFPYAVHDVLATYSTSTSELRVAVDRKSPCQTPVECERRELGTWSCTDAPDASHERLQTNVKVEDGDFVVFATPGSRDENISAFFHPASSKALSSTVVIWVLMSSRSSSNVLLEDPKGRAQPNSHSRYQFRALLPQITSKSNTRTAVVLKFESVE